MNQIELSQVIRENLVSSYGISVEGLAMIYGVPVDNIIIFFGTPEGEPSELAKIASAGRLNSSSPWEILSDYGFDTEAIIDVAKYLFDDYEPARRFIRTFDKLVIEAAFDEALTNQ